MQHHHYCFHLAETPHATVQRCKQTATEETEHIHDVPKSSPLQSLIKVTFASYILAWLIMRKLL